MSEESQPQPDHGHSGHRWHWGHTVLVILIAAAVVVVYTLNQTLFWELRQAGQAVSDAHILATEQQKQLDDLLTLIPSPDNNATNQTGDHHRYRHRQHHKRAAVRSAPTSYTTVNKTVDRTRSGSRSGPTSTPTCTFIPPGKATGRDNGKCPPGQEGK